MFSLHTVNQSLQAAAHTDSNSSVVCESRHLSQIKEESKGKIRKNIMIQAVTTDNSSLLSHNWVSSIHLTVCTHFSFVYSQGLVGILLWVVQ